MRNRSLVAGVCVSLLFAQAACAPKSQKVADPSAIAGKTSTESVLAPSSGAVSTDAGDTEQGDAAEVSQGKTGPWVGASAEGSMLAAGTRDTVLGVWVDVPSLAKKGRRRTPLDVALVLDTSGSMKGVKLESAREGAAAVVRSLQDGDIVALHTFSDEARTRIPATTITAGTREALLRELRTLTPEGGTNLFAGLALGEAQLAQAPSTHPLRRVVLLSDGIANRGPTSTELLRNMAQQGLRFGTQITSLGIGIDYDERTLDALAVTTNGRLFHVEQPTETAEVLVKELALMDATLASDAVVEVVPAPGVQVLGAEGLPATSLGPGNGPGLRIPLGILHAGQHREALIRIRLTDPALFSADDHSLASVRLRFRDAAEGGLERVQEVVARTRLSSDAAAVAAAADGHTKAIVALHEASGAQLEAARRVNDGDFEAAQKKLADTRQMLLAQAQTVTDRNERRRLEQAASGVESSWSAARAMPSQPPAARRASALKMNARAMRDAGY
jgi:Ca-activated chloride channel homolog